jgi:hypothetical protein
MKRSLGWGGAIAMVLVALGLYSNHQNHQQYDPQLPARVLSISEVKKVDLSMQGDQHYRLAEIEITTQAGKHWYYSNLPVKTDVVAGMGLHAWLADQSTGRGLYYEKAASTDGGSYTEDSPFLGWDSFVLSVLMVLMVSAMVGHYYSSPLLGLKTDDEPEPEHTAVPLRQSHFYNQEEQLDPSPAK